MLTKLIHMRFLLLIASIVLIFCITTAGQNSSDTEIKILVLDSASALGISNVNIRLKNSLGGSSSSSTGFCKIKPSSFPSTLILSHISYVDKEIIIQEPFRDTLIVYLQPQISTLEEVNIVYEVSTAILPEKFTVVDFTVCNNLVFALGNYSNNFKLFNLIVLDEYLDEIFSLKIPETIRPIGLYQDCLDNCHVLSQDSAYQIIQVDTLWQICCSYEINRFHTIMADCLFQADNYLIFKQINYDGYSQSFFAINVYDKSRHNFIRNDDFGLLQQLYDEISFLQANPSTALKPDVAMRFAKEFMFKPFKDALLHFDDTLYHFNFKDGKIDAYSSKNLQFIGRKGIDRRITSSIWNDEVLFDKTNKRAYLIFKNQLFEINTITGQLAHKNRMRLANKLLVSGGFIYYLIHIDHPFRSYKTIVRDKIR